MNKIKTWFKNAFKPADPYLGVKNEMAMVLEVNKIIVEAEDDKVDLKTLYTLLSQITLIDFIWVDQLMTPMEMACMQGNPWCLAAVIANGGDVHGKERNKNQVSYRPIHLACQSRKGLLSRDCVGMLIERGADLNIPNDRGDCPIHCAAIFAEVEVVEHLLKEGADVNATTPGNKYTPLALASFIPSSEVVCQSKKTAEEHHEDTEWRDTLNRSHNSMEQQPQGAAASGAEAAEEDHSVVYPSEAKILSLMRLLLKHGANINKFMDSTDILTIAAEALHVERVLLLLANGADVNNPRNPDHQCILKEVLKTISEKKIHQDSFFTMLSLLPAAGAQITLESLENGIRPVLDSRPELASVAQDVYQLLHDYASSPLSLKMLCRLRIRSQLPLDIDASIERYPVPLVLQKYLRFEDIVPLRTTD